MASYASLAEFRTYLRITDATDTVDDVSAQLALDAATEAIDLALGNTVALSPVPASIKMACELQAARWFKRQDAPFGVLGSPEFGNYARLLDRLDPDVTQLLNGYGERKRYGTAY